jgi:hypothetical protein
MRRALPEDLGQIILLNRLVVKQFLDQGVKLLAMLGQQLSNKLMAFFKQRSHILIDRAAVASL